MHPDQIPSDADLVRRLLADLRPEWARLPITAVASTGTANALYRIGDDLVARLPLRPSSTPPNAREAEWLPVIAPGISLEVPVPAATFAPTDDFPYPWAVNPWVAGADATVAEFDRSLAARDLAACICAIRRVDAVGGPPPSHDNYGRGVPLAVRDGYTREAIERAAGLVDVAAVTAAWNAALATPAHDGPRTWIHGDIASGNLIVRDGRITALIDWGGMAVGDPACDLLVAWEMFDADDRAVFRSEVDVDDTAWARGRGWALSTALLALPYYVETNPFMADQARHKITQVLADS